VDALLKILLSEMDDQAKLQGGDPQTSAAPTIAPLFSFLSSPRLGRLL
jgi:hypothetical protein